MPDSYIHGSSAAEQQRLALMNELINARCVAELELGEERLVLDVGCGTGQFTTLMAEKLAPTACVIAVERDPAQIETALRLVPRVEDEKCQIDYRRGDVPALPLSQHEHGAVDLAHARFLLEHVADPASVTAAMVDTLRPGGRIVLADDDHYLMRFWPEPAGVMAAWQAYYRTYLDLGADPFVGRKLVSLIHQAGARPRRNTQLFYGACYGSEEFAGIVDNIIGVMYGASAAVVTAGHMAAQDYSDALEALRRFATTPGSAVWYGINWAEGVKPG